MTTLWTKDEDDTLRNMRQAGHTFRDIGRLLGKSRNACCSRASRLGMEIQAPSKPVKVPTEEVADMSPPPPGRKLLSLLELTSTTCRWPFGDPKDAGFGFCGCACSEEQPYCDEHTAKARSRLVVVKPKRHYERKHKPDDRAFERWAA